MDQSLYLRLLLLTECSPSFLPHLVNSSLSFKTKIKAHLLWVCEAAMIPALKEFKPGRKTSNLLICPIPLPHHLATGISDQICPNPPIMVSQVSLCSTALDHRVSWDTVQDEGLCQFLLCPPQSGALSIVSANRHCNSLLVPFH